MFTEILLNCCVTLPVCALMFLALLWFYHRNGIQYNRGFPLGWLLLILLVTAMLSVTGTAGLDNVQQFTASMLDHSEFNFIPLADGCGSSGLILNVILFIPLGAAIPMLWRDYGLLNTVETGFFLSLFVELSQLFNFRTTDIDDLITNTLGTLIGYLIYRLFLRRITFFQADLAGKPLPAATISVSIIFIVYFLLASPLLNYLWQLVSFGY